MVEARIAPAYSYGDNDVLALELATEHLRRDIASNKIHLTDYNYYYLLDNGSYGNGLRGGTAEAMLYYLTGNTPKIEKSDFDDIQLLDSIYKDFITGNYAGYIELGCLDVEANTTDNKQFNWYKNSFHFFAITAMTENTITIVNPWDSEKEYEFTWEEFLKLRPDIGIVSTV